MIYGLYIWYCGSAPILLGLYTEEDGAIMAGCRYMSQVKERQDYDEYDPEFDDLVVCKLLTNTEPGEVPRYDYLYITEALMKEKLNG